MPLYTFRKKGEEETFEHFVSIADYDRYVEENDLERVWKAPGIVSGHNVKPADGFKDLLKQIKKGSGRDNTINTF